MKKILFTSLLALSVFLAACSTKTNTPSVTPEVIPTVIADSTVIAEGRVEPIQYAEIAFSASGVVSQILVKEGDAIKAGQPLIQLGGAADPNYANALLDQANAQKALDDLTRSRDKDLAQAAIDLKEAQKAYNKADDYLKSLTNSQKVPQTIYSAQLVSTGIGWTYEYQTKNIKGPAPKDWIEDAQRDLALKQAKLTDSQRVYDDLKDGPDAEQLPILQSRLEAAKAKVAAFTVTAPFDGIVAELKARQGSSINAGEIAVVVADKSKWIATTSDVTEIDVVKLKDGQPVKVTLDALPGLTLKGKILSIGQNYSQNQGDIVYKVTVLLTDADPAIRWGMTAAVKFEQ